MWDKFITHVCQDTVENEDLLDIECLLNSESKTSSDFLLPLVSKVPLSKVDDFSLEKHASIAQDMITKLNPEQRQTFDDTIECIDKPISSTSLFYVDGPRGTGKMFIYKCLYHHQIHKDKNVLCVAWAGIAAILLPNGRTAHIIFKLTITIPSSEKHLSPLYLDKKIYKSFSGCRLHPLERSLNESRSSTYSNLY